MTETKNLMMPGNPRYQPKCLVDIFGYDNLYKPHIRVEFASMLTMAEIGKMPAEAQTLAFSPRFSEMEQACLDTISTTSVDEIERTVTRHDIRALVIRMQQLLPVSLRSQVHLLLTSYDVVSTAQALQFKQAHAALQPLIHGVMNDLALLCKMHRSVIQIGRTHRQAAIPITAGAWLATILSRVLFCAREIDRTAHGLVGKISGPVGMYNSQSFFGIDTACLANGGSESFEVRVLKKLGLTPALASTQIAPPEQLAQYLKALGLLSAALGQFGRDCQHLMSSEIHEISEEFGGTQTGSSTMAHKRNPITFEGLEGAWACMKSEQHKVDEALVTTLQRDLVSSKLMRDFAIIPITLAYQLETLQKRTDDGRSFISRIRFNTDRMSRLADAAALESFAEPMYIALSLAGYSGDAHHFINHNVMPILPGKTNMLEATLAAAKVAKNEAIIEAIASMDSALKRSLAQSPRGHAYIGQSEQVVDRVVAEVRSYLHLAQAPQCQCDLCV